ncbi:hypothetical protein AB0M02_28825 [Actinoplanes sp. NPDC051861]
MTAGGLPNDRQTQRWNGDTARVLARTAAFLVTAPRGTAPPV